MEEYLKRLRVLAGLTEAPITDFGTVGDFNDPDASMHHQSDRRSVTDERMVQKIKQQWEKTPFNFNLYFVNKHDMGSLLARGLVDMEFVQQDFPELVNRISDNAINVIFTNNIGAGRIRLTPWIIAHRLSHVVNHPSRWVNKFNRAAVDIMTRIYENDFHMMLYELDIPGLKSLHQISKFLNLNHNIPIHFFEHIGTMNSARKRILTNEHEFKHESFAQYLITGKVTFNPISQSFLDELILLLNDYIYKRLELKNINTNAPAVIKLNKIIADTANQLPELFANGLKTYVGKVLVV